MDDDRSILIVEDHAVLSHAMARALEPYGLGPIEVVPSDDLRPETVLAVAARVRPVLVLLDLFLGDAGLGVPLIEPLRGLGARVLVLSATTDLVRRAECLEAGALAVLDKAMPFGDLVRVMERALAGEQVTAGAEKDRLIAEASRRREDAARALGPFERLTEREALVLRLLIEGSSPKQIARDQGVSLPTVRTQIHSTLQKLGVNSQREALAAARAAGWPPP